MNLRLKLGLLAMGIYLNSHAQWVEGKLDIAKNYYLTDVVSLDNQTFIGHDGEANFYLTQDYGATFIKRNIGTISFLGKLFHKDIDTGFVADYIARNILVTHDGWQNTAPYIITDGVDTAFQKTRAWLIHFKDQQVGFALGDSSKGYLELWRTENNGQSWTRITNQSALLGGFKLYFQANVSLPRTYVSGDTILISLPNDNHSQPDLLLKSYDNGLNWTRVEIPSSLNSIGHIAFQSALEMILTRAYYPPGSTCIARSVDGGVSWDTSVKLLEPYYRIAAVKNGKTTLFFCAGQGSSYSGDFGKTWHKLDNLKHQGIYFHDANHALSAVHNDGSGIAVRMFDGIFTGVKEVNQTASLSVYPNPSRGIITLQADQDGVLELRDNLGKVVAKFPVLRGENSLKFNLLPGIYFGHLDGVSKTVKILIVN